MGADLGCSVIEVCEGWSGFDNIRHIVDENSDLDWYVSGGVVRDVLSASKRKPKDFDIFVSGQRHSSILESLAVSGSIVRGQFGSPRWVPENGDGCYADIIFIDDFNNGLAHCETIVDALRQFDFTANAVAVNLLSGIVIDPVGGVFDAENKILRCVRFDFPDEPISDSLNLSRQCVLWCRLWHYAAILNFDIESLTLKWLENNHISKSELSRFETAFFSIDRRLIKSFRSENYAMVI